MGDGGVGEGKSEGGSINVSFGSSAPSVKLNGHGDGHGAGGGKIGDGGDICRNKAAPTSICFLL